MQTWIVVNPAAGSGRALQAGRKLTALLPNALLRETSRAGEATAMARAAEEMGVELLVAVGGDGTLQEVVTGLCLDARGQARTARTLLGMLPVGTGGDYRRSVGASASPHELATRLQAPRTRLVDVGLVEYQARDGDPVREAFINVLSFGLGGLTTRLVETSPKWLGGRVTYFWGALRANVVHRPVPLLIELDGTPLPVAPYANVAVCLGRYFGGGMQIAPNAELDDGLFDVVVIDADKLGVVALSRDIYRGTHVRRPSVIVRRCKSLRARPTTSGEVLLDLDGNQPGRLPLRVDVLPGALRLAL